MIPTGDVLYELDKRIKAGQVPGLIQSEGVEQFYVDGFHFNPSPHLGGSVGTYVVGLTFYATLFQNDPTGLSGALYGLDDVVDAPLIAALQDVVWDVVSTHPYTGIPSLTVSTEGLVMILEFNETEGLKADDTSPYGSNNFGQLYNGTTFEQGGVSFDGNDDYIHINNSDDLNNSIHAKRTITIGFQVANPTLTSRKQVIYEEGGPGRGLNIYIYDNRLYVGGWNKPVMESNWSGTFLFTDAIEANRWHEITLVLDAQEGVNTLQPQVLKAYLDGEQFGQGVGSQLWEHLNNIAIGNVSQGTLFHDQAVISSNNHGFAGKIDEVRVYNRALNNSEIAILAQENNSLKVAQENGMLVGSLGQDLLTQGQNNHDSAKVETETSQINLVENIFGLQNPISSDGSNLISSIDIVSPEPNLSELAII